MHTEETILALLATSDTAVKRAIKALAPAGFDGPDAQFLADVFTKLPRYQDRMTVPQYRRARKALPGYVGRLVEIANARMGESAPDTIDPVEDAELLPEPALERVVEDAYAWGSW